MQRMPWRCLRRVLLRSEWRERGRLRPTLLAWQELSKTRVKSQLMLFVNSLVDNPEFDSQSKETLTTPVDQMGGVCAVTDEFATAVAQMPNLAELVAEDRDLRQMRALANKVRTRHLVRQDCPFAAVPSPLPSLSLTSSRARPSHR